MTRAEEFSFRRTLAILGEHDIYLVGPERLGGYFTALKDDLGAGFGVRVFGDGYFSGVPGYNRLLKSKAFYKSFDTYEYILVVQTDALVLSDQLSEWCDRGLSYVGAPWFDGFDAPRNPLSFAGVGNGGFSLRKVHDFVRVLSYPRHIPNTLTPPTPSRSAGHRFLQWVKHRWLLAYSFAPLQPRVNEDVFWGVLVPRCCDFFSVPAPLEAVPFAFEVAPEYLYELNDRGMPFGCHAWERYNPQFWREVLPQHGINLP